LTTASGGEIDALPCRPSVSVPMSGELFSDSSGETDEFYDIDELKSHAQFGELKMF
jgi:hypothetical protein